MNRDVQVIITMCLSFLWKIAIVSDVFKVMGSSFQTEGAAREKASFVLTTISCYEIDDYYVGRFVITVANQSSAC